MLELSIVRGPLSDGHADQILREFNRLTNSNITTPNFRRWVQDGPDGPAYHAILTSGDRIAGHFGLIPLGVCWRGQGIPVARTEYFFVHEDFRTEKVRGFEDSFLSPAILLLDQLYRHCRSCGWGPFLVSAAEDIQPFHELVGCRPVEFHLHECLFVLSPKQAAVCTPNLRRAQRVALFGASVVQVGLWTLAQTLLPRGSEVRIQPLDQTPVAPRTDRIALFEEKASRLWRYPDEEYTVFCAGSDPSSYVIAKNGSRERYLRVCDWHFSSPRLVAGFVRALIDQAQSQGMLGVRWSLYGDGEQANGVLHTLRKLAFLCVPRIRRLLVYSEDAAFLQASTWRLSDSLFCFDH